MKTLEDVEDDKEREEILNESQEINIEKLTQEELEDIDLSIKQIGMLKPIINFEKGEDK